jgi:hypothetical protein
MLPEFEANISYLYITYISRARTSFRSTEKSRDIIFTLLKINEKDKIVTAARENKRTHYRPSSSIREEQG